MSERRTMRTRSSSLMHGVTMSSSTAATGSKGKRLPLVDYQRCGVRVVMIRSKQEESYGEVLYKCPNNVKVCGIGLIWYSRHEFCASRCSLC
jgi:hypothetical protein